MSESGDGPVSVVARQIAAHRDDFIADLTAATKAQIRVLDHDARMVDLLKASITEVVVAAIHYLDLGASETPIEAPANALAYARALAQRDVSLAALIRAYRIGHARFLDTAMGYAAALLPEQRVPTIVELVSRSAHWIDVICDQVGQAYEQERDRWVSRRSGLRQRWVGQLLDGVQVDIKQAEEALRYRLDGVHLAAVAWADPTAPDRDVATVFDQLRRSAATELGAIGRPLLVPADEREARLWFSLRAGTAIDPQRLRSAIESAGVQAHVVFGEVDAGLEGFRRSLWQAERVKTVVLAGHGRRAPQVVFHAEVAPIALMAGDMDGLRRFVAATLGGLGVDDERTGELRDTLREFLARNRSYVATAEVMMLHRNTIQYRVTQAMDLCGCSFDDPDAVIQVQVALEACRWMAPAVLHPTKSTGDQGR